MSKAAISSHGTQRCTRCYISCKRCSYAAGRSGLLPAGMHIKKCIKILIGNGLGSANFLFEEPTHRGIQYWLNRQDQYEIAPAGKVFKKSPKRNTAPVSLQSSLLLMAYASRNVQCVLLHYVFSSSGGGGGLSK